MPRLTRQGLRWKQWEQFKKLVRDYTILFWICVGAGIVFLVVAAVLFLTTVLFFKDRIPELGGAGFLAGVIGIGLIWAAIHARKQPWVDETKTAATKDGVGATSTGRHPFAAGDRDPEASLAKKPATAGESVSLVEADDPGPTQEPPPAPDSAAPPEAPPPP